MSDTVDEAHKMATAPTNLVLDGVLTMHDLYRTAKINSRRDDLCTGLAKDDFPELIEIAAQPPTCYLPDCLKTLATGEILTHDQWPSLTVWHAGLSCQIQLKAPEQGVVSDASDPDFKDKFMNARGIIKVSAKEKYYQFLCYELRRGTAIPEGVGIERDGENHVCLYPTGNKSEVSDVSRDFSCFKITVLEALSPQWRPFAVLRVKASGYVWPTNFPPDSGTFPLSRWVAAVVLDGEADLAVTVGRSASELESGVISWMVFFDMIVSVGRRFQFCCSYEEFIINRVLMKAVRFALNFAQLSEVASQW